MCIMHNAVCIFMYAQGYTVLTCVHYDTLKLECIAELRVLVYGMEYTHLVHACYCNTHTQCVVCTAVYT